VGVIHNAGPGTTPESVFLPSTGAVSLLANSVSSTTPTFLLVVHVVLLDLGDVALLRLDGSSSAGIPPL